jgi:rhomboid family GlyGly-CTERM serine protease
MLFDPSAMTYSARRAGHRGAIPLSSAALAPLPQRGGGAEAWRLERGLVLNEPWRLATGQLVHLGWAHLLMNLGGLAVVWALFGRDLEARQWGAAIVACGLGVGAGLLGFSPGLDWYAGFSGILHGLLAAAIVVRVCRRPAPLDLLLAPALPAKLVLEQTGGGGAGTAQLIGGGVAFDAHLYGALAGAAVGGLLAVRRRAAP